jgi:hypothetical protein
MVLNSEVVGPRGLESPYLRVCRRPILKVIPKVIPKTQNVRGSRVLFLKILQIVTLYGSILTKYLLLFASYL